MTILCLIAAVLVIGGFLVVIDRRDKRAHVEREAQRAELQVVLNRIQAPEVAVVQSLDNQPPTELRYVPFDDDAAYWANRNSKVAE